MTTTTTTAPKTENPTNITPMTQAEARALVREIHSRIDLVRTKLVELHRRQGWKALGYNTWKDFSEVEFNRDRRNLYYVVKSAEVEANLIESGIEARKIFHVPDSQLRVIANAPITLQKNAFEQLLKFQKADGKVTAKDAEAAVAAVYPNYCYQKVQELCLPAIAEGLKIPQHNPANAIYKFWEDKKKPLSKHQKRVFREPICDYLTQCDEAEDEELGEEEEGDSTSRDALEVASLLNEFQPETLSKALMISMADEYKMLLVLRLVPNLDREEFSEFLKEMKVETEDIELLSDSCYNLSQELDKAFGLVQE